MNVAVVPPVVAFVDASAMSHPCALPFLLIIAEFQQEPVLALRWSDAVLDDFWVRANRTRKAFARTDELRRFPDATSWAQSVALPAAPIERHVAAAAAASGAAFLVTQEPHLYAGLPDGVQVAGAEEFLVMLMRSAQRAHAKAAIVRNAPLAHALKCGLHMPHFWHELQSPP